MSDRGWGEEQFLRISEFLHANETSPSQTIAVNSFLAIAIEELQMVDTNEVIETCAHALCALATPYAEADGFDQQWKVDLQ